MDDGTEQAITKQQTMMDSAATGPQASHAYLDEIEFGFGESLAEATTNVNGDVSEEETACSVEEDSTAFVTNKDDSEQSSGAIWKTPCEARSVNGAQSDKSGTASYNSTEEVFYSQDEEMDFSTDMESVCDTASMNGMVSGDCRAPSDAGTDSTQESYGVSDYSHLPLKELVIKLEPCDIPVHIQASVNINRIVPFQPPPKLASSMSTVVNTPKVAPTLIPLTEVLTMHECEVVDCGFRTPKRQILEKHMALHPPERISLSRMYQLQKVAESHSIKISGIRQLKKAQPALNVTIPKNDDKQHKKLQKGKRKDKEQVAPKERLNPIPIACKPPEYPILSSNGLISNGLVYLPITQKSSNVTTSVHQVTNTSHDSSFQKLTVPAMPAHRLNGVVNGGTLPVASDLRKLSDTSPSTAMLLHKTIRSETVQSIANLDQVLKKLPGAECESSDGVSSEDEDVLATRYDIDRMLKNDSRGEDNSSLNTIDKLADQLPPYERKKMKKKYRPYKKQKRVMRKCTECDFTTDRQDKMAAHMNEHAGVMNECDEPGCTYKSYNLAHLKCHKYKRHRIDRKERVLCELCGADVSKENLQKHKLVKHFPERMKKKKCKYCDYEAYDSKRIIRHQRIHTGEKPHKCPHCDYSSNQSCNLKTHLRTHSGNKPFKCTHCDFAAAHNVTLKGHMKTKHSGVSG